MKDFPNCGKVWSMQRCCLDKKTQIWSPRPNLEDDEIRQIQNEEYSIGPACLFFLSIMITVAL